VLREYRKRPQGFADLLNPFALVSEGVFLQKDGSLMTAWIYEGPDMESATSEELAVLASHVAAAFRDLGNGWMVQADSLRRTALAYPGRGAFPDATSLLVDEERRRQYLRAGATYETLCVLTVCHLPPPDVQAKVSDFFVEVGEASGAHRGWETVLQGFLRRCDELEDALSDRLALKRMDSPEILGFLHTCATGLAHALRVPRVPIDLDYFIGSEDLVGGFEPRVGLLNIRPIAITGYPSESFPGILDFLNHLAIPYRWSNRFILLDATTAEARLRVLRRNWWQKRQGLSGMVKEALRQGGDTFGNRDAVRMAEDADDAVTEATSGLVRFGYYTSVLLLFGEDRRLLDARARAVLREFQHQGFAARVETVNALEAFLGSIPGHGYRNVRRPLIHTLNFADLIPTTSVFPGLPTNPCPFYPPASPPLFTANTSGCTPFRFHLHVSDVGHSLVIGPTGSGKSTLLGLIMAQFLRYEGAQVFAFDKGYSAFLLTKAVRGNHYDVAGPDAAGLAFTPLARVDEPSERLWAQDWLESLMALQSITVTPAHRSAIASALVRLGSGEGRTLTDFLHTVQHHDVRNGLRHYTLEGAMGRLLDAESDGLSGMGAFQVFELEHLLRLGPANVIPVLLYLFHRIEQRLTGDPSLLILEEAWILLDHPVFAPKIEEWLRVLRKQNCAVVLASQSLAEVYASPKRDLLLESCPTKIFLPNSEARSSHSSTQYRALGLSSRQTELIAGSVPKRHYYVVSPLGRRLIELALGPIALSFIGVSSPSDRKRAQRLFDKEEDDWQSTWLRERGLSQAAEEWKSLQEDLRNATA
jgi:type IV secretion system protein VirB4